MSQNDDRDQSSKLPKPAKILIVVTAIRAFDLSLTVPITKLFMISKLGFSESRAVTMMLLQDMIHFFLQPFLALVVEGFASRYTLSLFYYLSECVLQALIILQSYPATYSFGRSLYFFKSGLSVLFGAVSESAPESFEGNQFDLPKQEMAYENFLRIEYAVRNAFTVCGYIIAPWATHNFSCFGEQDCHIIPFSGSMCFAVLVFVVFWSFNKYYNIQQPEKDAGPNYVKCVCYGFQRWLQERRTMPKDHWMDHALSKYNIEVVNSVKCILNMFVILSFIPVYSCLFYITQTQWAYQAAKLDGRISNYILPAEHFELIGPISVLIIIPFSIHILDPILVYFKLNLAFKKMIFGGTMTAIAFWFAGFLELQVKSAKPVLPNDDEVQIRLFNGLNCTAIVETTRLSDHHIIIAPSSSYTNKHIPFGEDVDLYIRGKCFQPIDKKLLVDGGTALSIFIKDGKEGIASVIIHEEKVDLVENNVALFTVVGADLEDSVTLVDSKHVRIPMFANPVKIAHHTIIEDTKRQTNVASDQYTLLLNEKKLMRFTLIAGGHYMMTIGQAGANFLTITEPLNMHMAWMIIPAILILFGEIYFDITIDQLCYSESPMPLKNFGFTLNKFFEGIGLAISVIVNECITMELEYKYYLFTGMMLLNVGWIAYVGTFFKPKNTRERLF